MNWAIVNQKPRKRRIELALSQPTTSSTGIERNRLAFQPRCNDASSTALSGTAAFGLHARRKRRLQTRVSWGQIEAECRSSRKPS